MKAKKPTPDPKTVKQPETVVWTHPGSQKVLKNAKARLNRLARRITTLFVDPKDSHAFEDGVKRVRKILDKNSLSGTMLTKISFVYRLDDISKKKKWKQKE